MIQLLPQHDINNMRLHSLDTRRSKNSPSPADDDRFTPLVCGFTPGPYDVICARGAEAKNHIGNKIFRQKVQESVAAYAAADSKLYKSLVVSKVIEYFRSNSPDGGFVKKNNGVWYEVGDQLAREKVGQALRDQLSNQYKSSTKAKRRRWRQEATKRPSASDEILADTVKSNYSIASRMSNLERKRESFERDDASDDEILYLFTQNNRMLLNAMESDVQLQSMLLSLPAF